MSLLTTAELDIRRYILFVFFSFLKYTKHYLLFITIIHNYNKMLHIKFRNKKCADKMEMEMHAMTS